LRLTVHTLLRLTVHALLRLTNRGHALTYFPSMLALALISAISTDIAESFDWGFWWILVPLVLAGWVFVCLVVRYIQNVEPDKQLKVFRAKGLNNEKIDDPEIIEVGNNVVIFGKLQKYVKDDVVTPEVSSCYIYSINAQSGIKGLTAGERPTLLYNLNGQKVDAGYRGIVVKNGKKVLMK
jgi:hypothetical protein